MKLLPYFMSLFFVQMSFAASNETSLVCHPINHNQPAVTDLVIHVVKQSKNKDLPANKLKAYGSFKFTEYSGFSEGNYDFGNYPKDVFRFWEKAGVMVSLTEVMVFAAHYDDLATAHFILVPVDGENFHATLTIASDGDPNTTIFECAAAEEN